MSAKAERAAITVCTAILVILAVIGVFIISLLQQGIMAFGLGKGQQMIITGIIVIIAVYVDVSARRRKN